MALEPRGKKRGPPKKIQPGPGPARHRAHGPQASNAAYLAADGSGVTPPPDGWYDTGDIVSVEDGFVTIRGRAKRFAKIAGEMISLAAVETMVQELWPEYNHVVVSFPDPRKGETARPRHRQAGGGPRRRAGLCA